MVAWPQWPKGSISWCSFQSNTTDEGGLKNKSWGRKEVRYEVGRENHVEQEYLDDNWTSLSTIQNYSAL